MPVWDLQYLTRGPNPVEAIASARFDFPLLYSSSYRQTQTQNFGQLSSRKPRSAKANSIFIKEKVMKKSGTDFRRPANRRMFLRNGMIAAGAAGIGAAVWAGRSSSLERNDDDKSPITKGDIAILKFLQ